MADAQGQNQSPVIRACTISRDVQAFDLLIEDLDNLIGEAWGELDFAEAQLYLEHDEAKSLEFVMLAIDSSDEGEIDMLCALAAQARDQGIGVLVIAEDIAPSSLHQLLRGGADQFVPYPLPEGELKSAVARMQAEIAARNSTQSAEPTERPLTTGPSRNGAVIAVQGLAGGTGATTLACNLAYELAVLQKSDAPMVCLLDFDLQKGAVATYLDLDRSESVLEMFGDTDQLDEDVLAQCMQSLDNKVQVLTTPSEMVPLDLVGPEDIIKIIEIARAKFDYVVIDMPTTLVHWTDTVLQAAHVFFAPIEMDMRSAQNALRLKRFFQAEGLPFTKLRFVMNRAPKFTDMGGKARVKKLAESLGVEININLPDGGRAVRDSGDHGLPLMRNAAKNPLRKEIAKIAKDLNSLAHNESEAA
jgi:pilus assembly protein CpaE